MDKTVLLHPLGLQGLHSLQALVPSLLRREVELALEKLDLIWDRTYAWDMFLDMMVRHCGQRSLNSFLSLLLFPVFSFFKDGTAGAITSCIQEGQPRGLAQTLAVSL